MRKEFIGELEKYIVNTNKSIFDLDISYLEENYPNIRELKKQEGEVLLENPFFVYNECLKTHQEPKQRFFVKYKILGERGNKTEFTIIDNKTNKEYVDIFDWYPLKGKRGYYYPHDLTLWLNNTLVSLNRS